VLCSRPERSWYKSAPVPIHQSSLDSVLHLDIREGAEQKGYVLKIPNQRGMTMIKTALIVILAILLIISLSALLLYRRQVRELCRQLKDLEPGSNQRLTCSVRDRNFLSLCRMVNTYIDSQQKLVLQAKEAEEELKYTIASVSHDIR